MQHYVHRKQSPRSEIFRDEMREALKKQDVLELVVVEELQPELPRSPGVVHLEHGLVQVLPEDVGATPAVSGRPSKAVEPSPVTRLH